ncbi:hypothetical protein QWY28_13305 [Nocardioides sp. SOB77]|uniref:Uncharacterized protein n=1 Tax=Nocardioides oceani TaxID=3058369 RepID=A0ABT8FGY0_9ACTN|nr:hypothetical protein [Nocardioides oceani]MDN4173932.1 hypothetical protein [Nocardioides oceani]
MTDGPGGMPEGWEPDWEHYDPDPEDFEAWREVQELLDRSTGLSDAPPTTLPEPKSIEDRIGELRVEGGSQDLKLRRHLAYGAFIAVAVQLMIANVAFYIYGDAKSWDLDSSVMIAWLSATVIETLGVVLIIARNLFPNGGQDEPA